MRTLTASQSNVLGRANRSTHVRVQIDRGTNDFVNLRDLEGRDWIESIEYGDTVDSPVQTALVRLRQKDEELSLSPFMDGSKLNLGGTIVDIGNPIIVETAVLGQDAQPQSSDWNEVFRGAIDDIDWAGPQIALKCRGQGRLLVDTFQETQEPYGSAAPGTDIEDVMQDVLDDHINTPALGSVLLYSENGDDSALPGSAFNAADSPGFKILPFANSKATVMSELRKLARLIGYEVKYKWHANTSAFHLQLFSPGRPLRARGSLLLTSTGPVASDTFVINVTTVTAVAGAPAADQFQIASNLLDTAGNIADAINAGSESADALAWRITEGANERVVIEWKTQGTAGNSIVFTEALSNTTADGGGTLGGLRAGTGLSSPSYTFDQDRYFKIPSLKIEVKDIRNAMRLTFTEVSAGQRRTFISNDPASQAKYGRRYMEITEGANSQIDTFTEASDMLGAALSDLSEPTVEQALEVPYFWPGEPQDLYEFLANNVHYDTDQELAVSQIRHRLSLGSSRTIIGARGKPSGGLKRWLEIEGRPGVAPPTDLAQNASASGVVTNSAIGEIVVRYDDPRTMSPPILDWATTKVFAEQGSSDFTPTVSNQVAEGQQTMFTIGDLVPFVTYSIKLQIIDSIGNVGATVGFVAQATQAVGPYHENPDGQFDQLLRNPDLNIFTLGDSVPPDFWSIGASTGSPTWGPSDEVYFTTVTTHTGNRAIRIDVTAAIQPFIRSDFIPFTEDDLVVAGALLQGDVAPASTSVNIEVDYFDSSKTFISRGSTNITVANGAFEERTSAAFLTPTNTRFIKVTIEGTHIGTDYTLFVDRVGTSREFPTAKRTGVQTNRVFAAAGTDTVPDWTNTADPEEVGISFSTANDDYTIDIPGQYIWTTVVSVIETKAGVFPFDLRTRIQVDTGSGWVTVGEATGSSWQELGIGVARIPAQTGVLDLDIGDKVRAVGAIFNITAPAVAGDHQIGGFYISGKSLLRATR